MMVPGCRGQPLDLELKLEFWLQIIVSETLSWERLPVAGRRILEKSLLALGVMLAVAACLPGYSRNEGQGRNTTTVQFGLPTSPLFVFVATREVTDTGDKFFLGPACYSPEGWPVLRSSPSEACLRGGRCHRRAHVRHRQQDFDWLAGQRNA